MSTISCKYILVLFLPFFGSYFYGDYFRFNSSSIEQIGIGENKVFLESLNKIKYEEYFLSKMDTSKISERIIKLKKEVQKLEELKFFYYKLHEYKLENRINRAISYTNLKKGDYSFDYYRNGKNKEDLTISVILSQSIEDVNSCKNNAPQSISKSIIKGLKDYFFVVSLEENEIISFDSFDIGYNIEIKIPKKAETTKIKYKGEFGDSVQSKIYINGKKKVIFIKRDSLLTTHELGYFMGIEAQKEFSNLKLKNKKNLDSPVFNYSSSRDRISFSATINIPKLFHKDYKRHVNEVVYAESKIRIIQDSIKILELEK